MKSPSLILSAAIISTVLNCCKHQSESCSAEAFLGEWYTVKGDNVTYSFLRDSNNYLFVGTRNMRPVVFGTWKIFNNKFVISTDNGSSSSYRFKLKNDTLVFNEGEKIYTRTEPLEVKFPEVKILITLAGDFGNLKFSTPRQADLNWASFYNKSGNLDNPSLIGYLISSDTEVSPEILAEIYYSLEDYGFEPDTSFIKENCKVYHDDNQYIIVCVTQSGDSKNNPGTIQITSGYISK
jgi:hypothetical protein